MGFKLKVCGMRDPGNIQELVKLGPDFMGMIFYDKSPRFVAEDVHVDSLSGVELVGVFVNPVMEEVLHKASLFHFRYVQLHGEESVEMVAQLKSKGFKVIKVFRVGQALPIKELTPYEGVADYFLFDTQSHVYGGSGQQFNWDILEDYPFKTPFFLSGGIDLSDISAIGKRNFPQLFAIDINSKFEIEPGVKDIEKVKAFKALL